MLKLGLIKRITAVSLMVLVVLLTLPSVINGTEILPAADNAGNENLIQNPGFEAELEGWDINAGKLLNQNGGFEKDVASWNVSGASCTWTKGGADNSSGCAFVEVTNGFNDISQNVMLNIGTSYRITCSIKLAEKNGEYTESLATMLFSYDKKKTEYPRNIPVNSETWSKFDFIFTPRNDPENYGGLAKMYVRIGPTGQQNEADFDYYIDDFNCEELISDAEVTSASPGADGTGKCVKVTTGNSAPFVPTQYVPMEQNSWYIISAKVKMESGSAKAQFAVRHDNYTVEYIGNTFTITDQWTDVKAFYKSYTREIGAMSGDVYLCVGGENNTSVLTYYIDDVSVTKNTKLYINGDFELENDVTGWIESYKDANGKTIWSSSRPQWVSEPTHSGSGAAKIVPITNNLQRCAQFVHLEKDVWYQVSFWVKLEEGQGDSEAEIIRTQISDDVDTGSMYMASGTPVNDREWTEVSSYFKYNGTNRVADCQLFLRIGSEPKNSKIPYYFDDFSVKPVEPDQITFRGNTKIIIPQSGEKQEPFSAVASKEFDGITYEFDRDELFFQITDALPSGITFAGNKLTVQSSAPECELNLIVTSKTYPNLTKNVQIKVVSELTNLKDTIHRAETVYEETDEIISGSKKRFLTEIDKARQVLLSQPTLEEAALASAALEDATERFLRAADRNVLEPVLENARFVYESTPVGTAPGHSSEQNKQTLQAAISSVEEIINGTKELFYEEIVEIKRMLNDAVYDFHRGLVPFAEFFVDPVNGNDGNNGTKEEPFLSIERARDAAQTISYQMDGDIIVNLLGGTYDYSEKDLTFTAQDSGKNGYYIVYRAPSGELPVINGGKQINGWTLFDSEKNIYRAPAEHIQSRQFYVNGIRATRARKDIDAAGWTYDNGEFGHTVPAEFSYLKDLHNLSEAELVYYSAWTNPRCKIKSVSVDEDETVKVEMQQPGWNSIRNKGGSSAKNPWYIENAYEFLDEEGEWYLDAADGYLYYKPRQGENLENAYTVLAANDGEMVTIAGSSPDNVVKNLLFSGITFSYSTWMRPSTAYGHSDAQNNHLRDSADKTLSGDTLPPAAVSAQYAHSVDFTNCEFSHLGISALKMIRCIQDCRIYTNRFYDISGSAVNVGEPATGKIDNVYPNNFNYLPAHEKYYIRNNNIILNYIHHTAVDYRSAAAISAGFPIDMEIAYNTISDTAYSGMHIGYGWKSIPTSIMRNNQIHHNRILNVMNTVINDGGGIYTIGPTSGTDQAPNLIYENYFEGQSGYGGSVYNDQGSSFWKVERNVSNLSGSPAWSNANQEHRWLNYWSKDNNDMFADENYASDYQLWEDHGQNNYLGKTYYVTDLNWPEKAQKIINNAGIAENHKDLTAYVRAYTTLRADSDGAGSTVRFENTLGEPVSATIMLAAYDKDGVLVDLKTSVLSVEPGFSEIQEYHFNLSNIECEKVKLLIWEGSSIGNSNFVPLAAAKTVMLNKQINSVERND